MNDMSQVIIPKSDQINADDLIGGDMTIRISEVKITGGQEQPVSIYFDGSEKAFRPCKSMSRVLVAAWGPDAKQYVGRSLQLYRDPTVKWGGMEVGGIRIRAMTHIDKPMVLALTATKGSRKPYTVRPLVAAVESIAPAVDAATKWTNAYIGKIGAETTIERLVDLETGFADKLTELKAKRPELHQQIVDATAARRAEIEEAAVSEHEDKGEGFTDADVDFGADAEPAAD